MALVSVGAAIVAALWANNASHSTTATTLPVPTESFAFVDVQASGKAAWSRSSGDTSEEIRLLEGTLDLRIRRRGGDRPVTVRTPDGRIEDVGTTFRVVVRDGITTSVAVSEGRVDVELAGTDRFRLNAGDAWSRNIPPSGPSVTPVGSVVDAAAAPAIAKPAARIAKLDPFNAEDDAYLRVLELVRSGRTSEARSQARDYVRSFPHGFRVGEMSALANGQPDASAPKE